MAVFVLIPRRLDAREWSLSSWHGPVRVEAASPLEARLKAEEQLAIPVSDTRSQQVFQPWWNPALVKVEASLPVHDAIPMLGTAGVATVAAAPMQALLLEAG